MYVRQLFNHATFSYTYLVVDPVAAVGALIDPVKGKLRDYVQLSNEMGIAITTAIDTHSHDDRVSGLIVLRDLWGTQTVAFPPYDEPKIDRLLADGDIIQVGSIDLRVMHTPGHTENSCCLYLSHGEKMVFTGDTLLVRTVGLSDQPSSNLRNQYSSLKDVLMTLPDETVVYPGRDFKGWPQSTIGEERQFNPYLQAASLDDFLLLKGEQQPADVQALIKVEDVHDDDRLVRMLKGRAPVAVDDPAPLADDPSLAVPGWR